jgi:predicted membrane chloride channel (bestrophin family)
VWLCSQDLPFSITIPYDALAFSTSAVSLLLVFKTNSAYARWWEACKVSF